MPERCAASRFPATACAPMRGDLLEENAGLREEIETLQEANSSLSEDNTNLLQMLKHAREEHRMAIAAILMTANEEAEKAKRQ